MNYTSRPLGKLISFHQTSVGIEGKTGEAYFQVSVYSDLIIRVNISTDTSFDFPSYATIANPVSKGIFQIKESKQSVEIRTGKLVLRIAKDPVRFDFLDAKGKEINCEDPGLETEINQGQLTSFKKLQNGERFLGLGEKVGNLDRRGTGLTNWNTDHFGYGSDTDPIYSSIPFYIGIHNGLTYGIFVDNSSKSHFNFGASNNRFSSFTVEQGNLNYFFIYGTSVAEIIKGYTYITGRMEMPPLWSLGYQQCRYSYFPDHEVLNLANTFRNKQIPCDTIVLDIHYMDKYKIFTWDRKRFPDPKKMIKNLKSRGFEIVVICDPGIKIERGYEPFDKGYKEDIFVKYPDGTNYEAEVWPGWCCFPDFTNPDARKWWHKQLKAYTNLGIEGFWNDMNEIASWGNYLPNVMDFHNEGHPVSTLMARNIYGLTMARSTYEGAKKYLKGKRPFNLTRAAFAGIQRYSAKWTGDNTASDDHMILGIKLQNSLGLSGVAFTGNDIGGFHGDSSPELYARWIALGTFSPFFRGHSMVNTRDSEPWSYGEWVEEIARNYINVRYRMLPYIYSLFYQSVLSGIPVVRSLAIEHPFDDTIFEKEFQAQYYFGPGILVAPVVSTQSILKVYLPEGNWYDMFTGQKFSGNQHVYSDTPLHKIPLFVKAGSVIPFQKVVQSTKESAGTELIIHIYNGIETQTFPYYEDDGSTYAYQKEDFYLREMHFDGMDQTLTLRKVKGSYKSKFKTVKLVLHGFGDNIRFRKNGKSLKVQRGHWRFIEPFEEYDPLGSTKKYNPEDVFFAYFAFNKSEMSVSWRER